jgi:thioredoxin 1
MIAPALEELAGDMQGQAIVGKLNVDVNPQVSSDYGIRNIPTLLVFKNGQIVDKHVGAAPKSALAAKLMNHV